MDIIKNKTSLKKSLREYYISPEGFSSEERDLIEKAWNKLLEEEGNSWRMWAFSDIVAKKTIGQRGFYNLYKENLADYIETEAELKENVNYLLEKLLEISKKTYKEEF